jgi:hypothetical protein
VKKFLAPLAWLFLVFSAMPAGAQSLDSIAADLDRNGRYIEGDVNGSADAGINDANAKGVAYLQLDAEDNDADAQNLLEVLLASLNEANSSYQTIVLYEPGHGVWAVGNSGDPAAAVAAAKGGFAGGDVALGLEQFTNVLAGQPASGTTATTVTNGGSTSSGSSGGGFPWIWIFIIGALVWVGFRFFNSRKTKGVAKVAMEVDRKEIKEQLKDNADRVIDLGDQVISKGDPELIRLYEEASRAYQDVSQEVEGAVSIVQVDALDDKIDKAEWQFEVIEARLEGRRPPAEPVEPTLPPPPTTRSTRRSDKPRSRPAMDPDDSIFDERPGPTSRSRRRQPRRRSSGGMSGAMMRSGIGSLLLNVVIQMVLGGGRRQSRRSYGRITGSNQRSNQRGGGIQAPRGF